MKELSENEAMYKAAALCSASEHCRADVEQLLQRWGVAEAVQKRIINRLIDEKYIDETRYCRFFVNDKLRYNKWGRVKVAQSLRQKRIADDLSAAVLADIDEAAYLKTLHELLVAKRRTIKAASAYECNGKLIRFALGRGFEMDYIRRCLDGGEEEFED